MTDDTYLAVDRLVWGDGWIEPGQLVPQEEGRNYASLLRLGKIAKVAPPSDDQILAQLIEVTAERDELKIQLAAAGSDEADEIPPVEVPEGVVPGETPGWPLVILPLTDEQRELLAEADVSGTVTIDELRETIDLLDDAARADGVPAENAPGGESAERDLADDELPEGVKAAAGGWFELPDGRKVRRRDIESALAEAKA